jgi:hypothetical protein
MSINIHTKYLKYKKKYLELKKKMNGGGFYDIDTHLDDEVVYELTNGYIINTFMVSSDKNTADRLNLRDTPEIKCIYRTNDQPIVFIPKIKGSGILRKYQEQMDTFNLSTQRGERATQLSRLPNEIKQHILNFNVNVNPVAKKKYIPPIMGEDGFIENDYMYELKYESALPQRISTTKMRALLDSNDIDVAFAYKITEPSIYYIFSDVAFENNKDKFIDLLTHFNYTNLEKIKEIEKNPEIFFNIIKNKLLTDALDKFTLEKQRNVQRTRDQYMEITKASGISAIGTLPPTTYGDDDDYDN